MPDIMEQLTEALAQKEKAGPCEHPQAGLWDCTRNSDHNQLLTFDGERKSYCVYHAQAMTEAALRKLNKNEPNKDLLIQTFMQIVAHPEDWHQAAWRCSTGMCFAGWAGTLAGFQWADPTDPNCDLVVMPNGVGVNVGHVAEHILGLTSHQAAKLFSGGNTLEEITKILQEILGEAKAVPVPNED